jgi:hypothetical protein
MRKFIPTTDINGKTFMVYTGKPSWVIDVVKEGAEIIRQAKLVQKGEYYSLFRSAARSIKREIRKQGKTVLIQQQG